MGNAVVNGVRLAYERSGAGDPIVLIGGTGMPAVAWELSGVCEALRAAGRGVIAITSHGVSPSDAPPPPYTVEGMAADIAALIDSLELGNCDVVGYSLGGFLTERLARTRPDLVARAVLLASAGPLTATLRASLQTEAALIESYGHLPAAFAKFETLRTSLPPRVLRDDPEEVATWWELLAAQESCWTSAEGQCGQAAAAMTWTLDERRMDDLREIDQPVLVVAFEHDVYFPPWAGREAAQRLPNATFVEIDGAAHGGLMTHSEACARELVSFFEGP